MLHKYYGFIDEKNKNKKTNRGGCNYNSEFYIKFIRLIYN